MPIVVVFRLFLFSLLLAFQAGAARAGTDRTPGSAAVAMPELGMALPDPGWRDTVSPGERDPRVAELRHILVARGVVSPSAQDPYLYDQDMIDAVRSVQARLGIEETGVMTPELMERLVSGGPLPRPGPVPASLTSPVDMPATSVRVSIAADELRYVRDGRTVLQSRVIIGAPTHQTPELRALITGVIFNPSWNVPEGIEQRKIIPHMFADPDYLEKNHIDAIDPVSGRAVAQDVAMEDADRYRYRQRPGDFNSLGAVKLDMPNPYTVYLHDTPERELFRSEDLRQSSGCVRVEEIMELARSLLGEETWAKENVDERLASGQTFRIALPKPVPVIFYYRTAETVDGEVRENGDPYGLAAVR